MPGPLIVLNAPVPTPDCNPDLEGAILVAADFLGLKAEPYGLLSIESIEVPSLNAF